MKMSVASDERTHLTEAVVEELRRRGERSGGARLERR